MTDLKTISEDYVAEQVDISGLSVLRRCSLRFFIREFVDWLSKGAGVTRADQVTPEAVIAWLKNLGTKRHSKSGLPLQPGSICTHLVQIRMFCFWMAKHGYLSAELVDRLPSMREPPTRPQVVLRHEEARQWLESLPMNTPRDFEFRALAEFLYSSGARAQEAVQLTLSDVDLANATARVLGKGKKERIVPIGRTAMRQLEIYLAGVRPLLLRRTEEVALWLGGDGRRLSYAGLWRLFQRPSGWAGPRMTPHVLRRSCATELIRSGASIWDVKELLGHDDLETLERYALLDIGDLKMTHARCHPRDRVVSDGQPDEASADSGQETPVSGFRRGELNPRHRPYNLYGKKRR